LSKILKNFLLQNYRIIFTHANGSAYKVRNVLINPTFNYLHIFTSPLISNFTKIHLVEGGLLCEGRDMDGLTDRKMMKLMVAFNIFGHTPDYHIESCMCFVFISTQAG